MKKGRKKKKSIARGRGYSLERYAVLTLECMGYHVKRNAMSYGTEDVVATHPNKPSLLVQAKNQRKKGGHSMTVIEKEILRRHGQLYGMIPIHLYTDKKGKKIWQNLITKEHMDFPKYTTQWYEERQAVKKKIKDIKKEKGLPAAHRYILDNWDIVKYFVC